MGGVKGCPVPVVATAEELLKKHSLSVGECIEWQGYITRTGYGQTKVGGRGAKSVLAHRLAYEVYRGPIPSGLHVLHKCDNRRCVNPDHLFLGTNQDNIQDRVRKQRPGSRAHAKLTEYAVSVIRWLLANGYNQSRIARAYRVDHTTVWQVHHNITWRTPACRSL